MKQCVICNIEKSIEDFYVHKRTGPSSKCKICTLSSSKKYYSKNKNKVLEKAKEYHTKNRQKRLTYLQSWQKENQGKIKEHDRKHYLNYSEIDRENERNRFLKRKYNLSILEYDELLTKQNGVCFICFQKETNRSNTGKGLKRLSVDHCHKTGKIRGLLCANCNQGLGHFRENIEYLENAIRYLKNAEVNTMAKESHTETQETTENT